MPSRSEAHKCLAGIRAEQENLPNWGDFPDIPREHAAM